MVPPANVSSLTKPFGCRRARTVPRTVIHIVSTVAEPVICETRLGHSTQKKCGSRELRDYENGLHNGPPYHVLFRAAASPVLRVARAPGDFYVVPDASGFSFSAFAMADAYRICYRRGRCTRNAAAIAAPI